MWEDGGSNPASCPMLSGLLWARRAGTDNGADMLSTQSRCEPARHESVDNLHTLNVARVRHDFQERTVKRQCAWLFREFGITHLANQLRILSIGAIGIGAVHAIHILHDRETSCPKRIRDQERTRVRPVNRDTGGWELMVVIGRIGATHDCSARALAKWIASWFAMVGFST